MKWLLTTVILFLSACAPVVTTETNSYTITETRTGQLVIGASQPITQFEPASQCEYLDGIFDKTLKVVCQSPVVATVWTAGKIEAFYTNDNGIPLSLPGN